MDDVMERGHLRLVTDFLSEERTVQSQTLAVPVPAGERPRLELIQSVERDEPVMTAQRRTGSGGTQLRLFSDVATSGPGLLGFFDMYRAWGDSFASLVEQIRPVWIFDLRPSPSFNLIRLDRRRAFRLFDQHDTAYYSLNVMLDLWERRDPRLASGELAEELNQTAAQQDWPAMKGPIVFLVDDPGVTSVGIDVFPRHLQPRPRGGWQVHRFDNRATQHV